MMYRGEQFDSDLGLYYLRARYYSPLTGRFMSRDPNDGKVKVPATLHKYLYTFDDPVNRIDPRGREVYEEYHVTMIPGGSLGPIFSWKVAIIYTFLSTYLAQFLAEPLLGEGPPGTGPPDEGGEGSPGEPPPPEPPGISSGP
jgi:RHS repeat-associated protein